MFDRFNILCHMFSAMATETEGGAVESSSGLDENVAGALAYILGIITGVLFLVMESDNKFVRFHAAQSIALSIAFFVLYIVVMVIQFVLLFIPRVGFIVSGLFSLVWLVLWLGGVIVWLLMMYKAYNHEEYRLPVIGKIAANMAS